MNRLLMLLLVSFALTPVALRAEEPDPPPPDAEESAESLPEPDGEVDPATADPIAGCDLSEVWAKPVIRTRACCGTLACARPGCRC